MSAPMLPIPNCPGYAAASDGSIWSSREHGKVTTRWRKLKPGKVGKYLVASVCAIGEKHRQYYVHQLVLLAFVGPCPVGMECIHKNDIQIDNRLDNLEYGTHKRNCELRRANGKDKLGEQRKHTKLTAEKVTVGRNRVRMGTITQAALARELGVSVATVNDFIIRRTWKHVP